MNERSTTPDPSVVPRPHAPGIGFIPSQRRSRNALLAQLPPEEYAALVRHLIPVTLTPGTTVSEVNQPVEYLYFPDSGMLSAELVTSTGAQVEIGVIGREGFSGLPALLNQPELSRSVVVQARGEGVRLRASVARAEFLNGGVFQRLVHAFIYLQFAQITQSVVCNRLHEVEQRLARWLLTASDRSESDSLQVTQEFLAQMLGVQRSTVTVAAGELQRRGLISYSRGKLRLLNRPTLAGHACECYHVVNSVYDRILRRTENGQLSYGA
jgi:CRP-like cAMP-binding protein